MERIREARRMTMAAAPNGLSRRRQQQQHHRTNSLRDSPEDDGAVELQDTGRLRDRGIVKRDRDPDRDRERERDRERDRLTRSKRRRGERMMHGSNREDGGDDSSEESVNDDEDDEGEDGGGGGPSGGFVRMLPPNPGFSSPSSLLNHRKSFPPPTKVLRPASTWKAADEMIGVSVPRKARSASTKRSHDCWASGGGIVGEQILRQASTSPARLSGAPALGIGASQSPASPSSSNVSVRKKIKPSNGAKLRPPKSGSKSSSSAQDEIEIEIAEVLYGMMRQPQGPTKQETGVTESMKLDCKEANNKSSCDKSKVLSPISNSQSVPPLSSSVVPQNSGSSITAISAVAPKRKRPRPVKYDEESPSIFTDSPIFSSAKAEGENLPAKIETSTPNFEKTAGSTPENGSVSCDAANSQASEPHADAVKLERFVLPEPKSTTVESDGRNSGVCKDKPKSPKKDSPAQRKSDDNGEEVKVIKASSTMFEAESHREDKLHIDLMAPPPLLRSSPERDGDNDFVALEPKPVVADAEMVHELKPLIKEDEKGVKVGNKSEAVAGESEKARITAEETESQRPVLTQHKERSIDLQLDLEKTDKDSVTGIVGSKKLSQNSQKHQQPNAEKNALPNSMPPQMSVHSWPGLPTMGYMAAPLQGVVSMDGSTVSSTVIPPPHLLFNQPRPKRCATHCYIARNISYHQQIARMNPFWPAAAGSASLYATKPSNPSVMPSTDHHNSIPGRNAQEKGPSLAMFPGHFGKEKCHQTANMVESTQRKQILLQQSLPPGAASNILHGPAFIFPLHQQQAAAAAAAASVCSGAVKSNAGSVSSSTNTSTGPVNASATGPATTPAMSFSYPNIPGNETQYLAILQNNAYPFPIPAHVGAPPAYRGTHPQALPFFNGSFYPSQIIHPSQLQPQPQPQPQQQLPAQSQHSHQGRQSTSFSGGSTSSQKHLQNNQHQKPSAGSGSMQSFPPKNQPLQQQQQRQQLQNHNIPYRAPQMDSDMGSEENSAIDGRFSRAAMSLYGQNFAIPVQPANFALMTSTSVSGMSTPCTSSGSEKKQQQPVSKAGVETSQAFAIPFAPINGSTATPAIDLSSIPQNHPIVKSHGYQMMAAAAVAQQQKTYVCEEVKPLNGDSSNAEDERKTMGGKIPASIGQSIAFSRSDMTSPSTCAMPGNTVIDSSSRSLNLGSASCRPSSSVAHAALNPVYAPTSQQQLSRNQQQQQILQLHKNQQFSAVARSKISTSNGSVYTDHLPSTPSPTSKFPTTASPFHQNLVQSGNPAQSTQWKNSGRAPTSKPASPSMPSAPSSSAKALPQPQGRSQQTHMQISFAANAKSSTAPVMQPSISNQSPSPPIMVGSPTTSSMSKSAGGSPRTTSSSTSNKFSQASSLSSQQLKNSQSVPSSKSSPVGGRNVPSILGTPHLTPAPNTVTKSQVPHQQQQPHISKQALQQAQLFFSNAYLHAQTSQSSKRKDVPKS